MCGENITSKTYNVRARGSPPRVRGKRWIDTSAYKTNGITPACAGKTFQRKFRTVYKKDHPRVCGENDNAGLLIRDAWGSPPRVRGKLEEFAPRIKDGRITPACAGKTLVCVMAL